MTALSGQLSLQRAVISEVVEDPNTEPLVVVAGTSSALTGSSSQPKVDQTTLTGEFRQYGNGNTRLILGSASTRQQPVVLMALTPDQVQIIRDLAGHVVCYRDIYGRKMFGSYLDTQVAAIPFSGKVETGSLLQNIAITLTRVSYDEAV